MLYGFIDLIEQKTGYVDTWSEYLKIRNSSNLVKKFIITKILIIGMH